MLIPSLGGNVDEGLRVDEHRLGRVVPGASQPHVGDVDPFVRPDDVVLEHVAPLHVGSMRGSHDVAA